MATKMRAVVIGLGSMGGGAAASLLRAGFETTGVDPAPAARERFAAAGGRVAATPADAMPADIVFVFVVNAAQTEQALFGPDGAVAAADPGTIFALCATMPPAETERLAARLDAARMRALDAPVSGGAAKAASGEMTIMASAPAETLDAAAPALDAIAAQVLRLGDAPGVGSRFKTINQLLAGVHIAAMAEAMTLAAKMGLDLARVHEVIGAAAGASWMFENRGAHVVAGDYAPRSAVDIFVKDLGIVAGAARSEGAPTPLTDAARALFEETSAAGMGREDDAAVAKTLARRAGARLPGMAAEDPS